MILTKEESGIYNCYIGTEKKKGVTFNW